MHLQVNNHVYVAQNRRLPWSHSHRVWTFPGHIPAGRRFADLRRAVIICQKMSQSILISHLLLINISCKRNVGLRLGCRTSPRDQGGKKWGERQWRQGPGRLGGPRTLTKSHLCVNILQIQKREVVVTTNHYWLCNRYFSKSWLIISKIQDLSLELRQWAPNKLHQQVKPLGHWQGENVYCQQVCIAVASLVTMTTQQARFF